MTRTTYLTLMAALTLLACSKGSGGDDTPQAETIELQLSNSYMDSAYLTVENHTTPSLSVSEKRLPPQGTGTPFFFFTAKKGDHITVKGVVKPNRKWARHPLFLTSVTYDTALVVDKNTSLISYEAPASKIVQLQAAIGPNMRTQYVRGTITYGTSEDSLFYAQPGELVTYQTIGYFKTSDVQGIDIPRVVLYTGTTKPYTRKETSVLWARGGSYSVGGSTYNAAEAPSVSAPVGRSSVYQYIGN